VPIGPGESVSLDGSRFDGLIPRSASLTFAVGPIARLDVPELLLSLDRYQVPARVGGETIAEYGRSRLIGGIGAGRKLGKSGEVMAGVRAGAGRIERQAAAVGRGSRSIVAS
jgi:hypothetical protein